MADGITTQATTLATIPSGTEIATDDAGASGHVQVIKLAISADGSATVIPATAADGLLVEVSNPGDFPSGSGSNDDPHTATFVSSGLTTATTLYTAGDQMGPLFELTNMAAASGGAGYVGSLLLLCDVANVIGAVRAWFFTESVTPAADNAAFSVSDADMAKCVGFIEFPSPTTATLGTLALVRNVNLDYDCVATSLFVALQTLSTHANHFAAADDLHFTARAFRLS